MTKIAVIDDEEIVRTSLVNILLKVGYEVIEYTDAAFALADKCLKDVDVIITDLAMPTRGEILIQTVRSRKMEIPIIVLSGFIEEKEQKLKAMGVQAVLQKPYTLSELLGTIDSVI